MVIDNKDYNYTLVVSGQNFQIVHHDDGKNLTYKHGVNVSQSDDGGNYRGLKCTKVLPKITNDEIFGAQTKNNMKIFKRLTSDLTFKFHARSKTYRELVSQALSKELPHLSRWELHCLEQTDKLRFS